MTFVRAQRYLTEKSRAASGEHFFSLCMRLGRIHAGIRKVCVSDNADGACRAAYLERILLCAGYRVGRMTRQETEDLRSRIRLDGQPISHKQVCELTEQIMQGIDGLRKGLGESAPGSFDSEQKICALAMLAFCCHGCDVIIFEAARDHASDPMSAAAPYTLVMPCGFGTKDTAQSKKQAQDACLAIKRGTREVVTGFTGGEVYNLISQACAAAGSRLTVPAKSEAVVKESALAKTEFTYRGKGPYRLHSSYSVQFEAALAAIEACFALRRDGVRLPGAAIASGLQSAEVPLCFDVLTVRPGVIVSVASSNEDVRALLCALHQKQTSFGGRVVLCVQGTPDKLLTAFDKEFASEDAYAVEEIIYVGQDAPQHETIKITACTTVKRAAKHILAHTDPDVTVLCPGTPAFAHSIKQAVNDALIGLS